MKPKSWSLEAIDKCPRCGQLMTSAEYYIADRKVTDFQQNTNYGTMKTVTTYNENYSNLKLKRGSVCLPCGKKRDRLVRPLRYVQLLSLILLPVGIIMLIIEGGTMSTSLEQLGFLFAILGVLDWFLVYKGYVVKCHFTNIDKEGEKYGPKAERLSSSFVESIKLTPGMLSEDKCILSTLYVKNLRENNKPSL